MFRLLCRCLFAIAILLAFISASLSQQMYYTNEPGKLIGVLNWATGARQTLLSTAGIVSPTGVVAKPDSLILNPQGQIIYSLTNVGEVWLFDPSTGNNTMLVGGLPYPRDLVMDPSGTSVLIGLNARGGIVRYSFITGTATLFAKNLGAVDGLAFDPAGELFAVITHNQVCQIEPVAPGTVLKCIVLEPHYLIDGGDGMTYDPYSGHLWVTHIGIKGNGLIELPTDLSSQIWWQTGKIKVPDGIVSDTHGNLYIGATLQWVVKYNIPTNTIIKSELVPGVDGVALIPGTF